MPVSGKRSIGISEAGYLALRELAMVWAGFDIYTELMNQSLERLGKLISDEKFFIMASDLSLYKYRLYDGFSYSPQLLNFFIKDKQYPNMYAGTEKEALATARARLNSYSFLGGPNYTTLNQELPQIVCTGDPNIQQYIYECQKQLQQLRTDGGTPPAKPMKKYAKAKDLFKPIEIVDEPKDAKQVKRSRYAFETAMHTAFAKLPKYSYIEPYVLGTVDCKDPLKCKEFEFIKLLLPTTLTLSISPRTMVDPLLLPEHYQYMKLIRDYMVKLVDLVYEYDNDPDMLWYLTSYLINDKKFNDTIKKLAVRHKVRQRHVFNAVLDTVDLMFTTSDSTGWSDYARGYIERYKVPRKLVSRFIELLMNNAIGVPMFRRKPSEMLTEYKAVLLYLYFSIFDFNKLSYDTRMKLLRHLRRVQQYLTELKHGKPIDGLKAFIEFAFYGDGTDETVKEMMKFARRALSKRVYLTISEEAYKKLIELKEYYKVKSIEEAIFKLLDDIYNVYVASINEVIDSVLFSMTTMWSSVQHTTLNMEMPLMTMSMALISQFAYYATELLSNPYIEFNRYLANIYATYIWELKLINSLPNVLKIIGTPKPKPSIQCIMGRKKCNPEVAYEDFKTLVRKGFADYELSNSGEPVILPNKVIIPREGAISLKDFINDADKFYDKLAYISRLDINKVPWVPVNFVSKHEELKNDQSVAPLIAEIYGRDYDKLYQEVVVDLKDVAIDYFEYWANKTVNQYEKQWKLKAVEVLKSVNSIADLKCDPKAPDSDKLHCEILNAVNNVLDTATNVLAPYDKRVDLNRYFYHEGEMPSYLYKALRVALRIYGYYLRWIIRNTKDLAREVLLITPRSVINEVSSLHSQAVAMGISDGIERSLTNIYAKLGAISIVLSRVYAKLLQSLMALYLVKYGGEGKYTALGQYNPFDAVAPQQALANLLMMSLDPVSFGQIIPKIPYLPSSAILAYLVWVLDTAWVGFLIKVRELFTDLYEIPDRVLFDFMYTSQPKSVLRTLQFTFFPADQYYLPDMARDYNKMSPSIDMNTREILRVLLTHPALMHAAAFSEVRDGWPKYPFNGMPFNENAYRVVHSMLHNLVTPWIMRDRQSFIFANPLHMSAVKENYSAVLKVLDRCKNHQDMDCIKRAIVEAVLEYDEFYNSLKKEVETRLAKFEKSRIPIKEEDERTTEMTLHTFLMQVARGVFWDHLDIFDVSFGYYHLLREGVYASYENEYVITDEEIEQLKQKASSLVKTDPYLWKHQYRKGKVITAEIESKKHIGKKQYYRPEYSHEAIAILFTYLQKRFATKDDLLRLAGFDKDGKFSPGCCWMREAFGYKNLIEWFLANKSDTLYMNALRSVLVNLPPPSLYGYTYYAVPDSMITLFLREFYGLTWALIDMHYHVFVAYQLQEGRTDKPEDRGEMSGPMADWMHIMPALRKMEYVIEGVTDMIRKELEASPTDEAIEKEVSEELSKVNAEGLTSPRLNIFGLKVAVRQYGRRLLSLKPELLQKLVRALAEAVFFQTMKSDVDARRLLDSESLWALDEFFVDAKIRPEELIERGVFTKEELDGEVSMYCQGMAKAIPIVYLADVNVSLNDVKPEYGAICRQFGYGDIQELLRQTWQKRAEMGLVAKWEEFERQRQEMYRRNKEEEMRKKLEYVKRVFGDASPEQVKTICEKYVDALVAAYVKHEKVDFSNFPRGTFDACNNAGYNINKEFAKRTGHTLKYYNVIHEDMKAPSTGDILFWRIQT
jgi:hypothetical protein